MVDFIKWGTPVNAKKIFCCLFDILFYFFLYLLSVVKFFPPANYLLIYFALTTKGGGRGFSNRGYKLGDKKGNDSPTSSESYLPRDFFFFFFFAKSWSGVVTASSFRAGEFF